MEKFAVYADMGSVKISTHDISLFFANELGDGKHYVYIYEKEERKEAETKIKKMKFVGHFTVKEPDKVFLCSYDCDEIPVYLFKEIGRYFVYAMEGTIVIMYCDNRING